MLLAFALIALVTLGAAGVAMLLRNLIHSALLLVASWTGIAAFYLWAGAEFVAFAQMLVYVGAVSMVVLFAVLMTRHSRQDLEVAPDSRRRTVGALIAGGSVLGVLAGAVIGTDIVTPEGTAPGITVKQLGTQLMGTHGAAVLIVALVLTVALIGAVVIASIDRTTGKDGQ